MQAIRLLSTFGSSLLVHCRGSAPLLAVLLVCALTASSDVQSASAAGISSSLVDLSNDDGEMRILKPLAYENNASEIVRSLYRAGGQGEIVSSIVSAAGTTSASRELFNAPLGFDTTPINASTGLVVASDPSGGQVLARTTKSDGSIGPLLTVASDVPSDSGFAAVAAQGDDSALVVWTDTSNSKVSIFARAVSASSDLGPKILVEEVDQAWTDEGVSHRRYLNDIEADGHGDGTSSITWQDSDCHSSNCFTSIQAARLDSVHVRTWTQVLPRTALWTMKKTSARSDGSLDIVWSERLYWQWRTYLVHLDESGSASTPARKCNSSEPDPDVSARKQCLFNSNGWSYEVRESFGIDSGPDGGETLIRSANGRLEHYDISPSGYATPAYGISDFPTPTDLSVVDVGVGAAFGIWSHSTGGVRASGFSASGPLGPEISWTGLNYPQPKISRVLTRNGSADQVVAWAAWFDSSVNATRLVKFVPLEERSGPAYDSSNPNFSRMLSMGDSVSSGEGIGYGIKWVKSEKGWRFSRSDGKISDNWLSSYMDGVIEEPPEACRRSAQAYPYDVADAVGASLTHIACSGATAHKARYGWTTHDVEIPAQLPGGSSPSVVDPKSPVAVLDPELVTLTIGANDVKFGDFVEKCYTGSCGGTEDEGDVSLLLARQKNNLREYLTRINADAATNTARPLIAIAQYYDPFPVRWERCNDTVPAQFHGNLSSGEMGWLRQKLGVLNTHISDVVYERDSNGTRKFPNAITVDLEGESGPLGGHRWCSDDPWIYGPSINLWPSLGGLPGAGAAPFHPTEDGQAAIASTFVQEIRNSSKVSDAPSWLLFKFGSGLVRVFVDAIEGGGLSVRKLGAAVAATTRFASKPRSDTLEANLASSGSPEPNDIAVSDAYELTFSGDLAAGMKAEFLDAAAEEHAFQWNGEEWIQLVEERLEDRLRVVLLDTGTVLVGKRVPTVQASFFSSPPCQAPCEVAFDSSESEVAVGTIDSYEWEFGNGQTESTANPAQMYDAAGTYLVSLTVESDAGARSQVSHEIEITPPSPSIAIDVPETATAGAAVSLRADATTNDMTSPVVTWEFDGVPDPQSATAKSYVFAAPGRFTVRAYVANGSGEIATDSKTISVVAAATPPSTGGSGSTTPIIPGLRVFAKSTKITIGQLRRAKALRIKCALSAPGECAAQATVDRKTARALGIPNRRRLKRLIVARGKVRLSSRIPGVIRMRPAKQVLASLLKARRRVVLSVELRGAAGGQSARTKVKVALRP